MRAGHSDIRVGVIVNNVGGYSRGVLRGIAPFASARAWVCRVEGVNETSLMTHLTDFNGLIVQAATPSQLTKLSSLRIPVVNVSSKLESGQMPSVVSDDKAVGRLGAEHFLRLGYRNFIFYAPYERQFATLRHEGFAQRLLEADATALLVQEPARLAKVLLKARRPLAVMACNDRAALAVLESCRAASLRVPDEVAVLGVDNDDLIQGLAYPPLSTINTARERIGFEAAAMLERLLNRQPIPSSLVLVPPQGVITRQSTDTLAIADAEVAEAARYVHANAGRMITVNDVARAMTISRRQLERRFRAALGRSILDEILRVRIDRARQLLIETELTLPQVAMACGFSSASYFNVVFRKIIRSTPGAFRASYARAG
ncbi:DNA-binding transcriptional regulator [soil metagenome]